MKRINIFWAFSPILLLIALLSLNVIFFSDNATSGPNQIALVISAMFGVLIAKKFGIKWESLQKGIVESISSSMNAILILLIIGSLAGTWLISGIIPAMIYYGVEMSPIITVFMMVIFETSFNNIIISYFDQSKMRLQKIGRN